MFIIRYPRCSYGNHGCAPPNGIGLAARRSEVDVYRVERMELRKGDCICWIRNDPELGPVNCRNADP